MSVISRYVEEAVAKFGSQRKLAIAAGVAQPTIHKAIKTGRVGVRLAQGIHHATRGQITKTMLRPDLWPPLTLGKGK